MLQRMGAITNLGSSIALLLIFQIQLIAQSVSQSSLTGTASISGTVAVSGKPAFNVLVSLQGESLGKGLRYGPMKDDMPPFLQQVRTDADGRFRFPNLPAGTFRISAGSMLYAHDGNEMNKWKNITLDDGEAVENVSLSVIRGGVISGRLTDARGKPMVMAEIKVMKPQNNGTGKTEYQEYQDLLHEVRFTDDRGVYRIFGLPKGRYAVTIGTNTERGGPNLALNGILPVWYPSTTNPQEAKVLEIDDGTELTDIDLALGEERPTYAAGGRVVDAESGQPVANVTVSSSPAITESSLVSRSSYLAQTDKNGRFRLPGLGNGTHMLSVNASESGGSYYAKEMEFSISNANLDNLEVKLQKGATIEGTVVFEGSPTTEFLAQLKSYPFWMSTQFLIRTADGSETRSYGNPKLENNSFRILGVPPSTVFFNTNDWLLRPWRLARIEMNGSEMPQGIEAHAGQKISGVRLVFIEGRSSIRGEIRIAGGALPANVHLYVYAQRVNRSGPAGLGGNDNGAAADQKGRFFIEGLPPGEYGLIVRITEWLGNSSSRQIYHSAKPEQQVNLSNNGEINVVLEIDPSKARKEKQQ